MSTAENSNTSPDQLLKQQEKDAFYIGWQENAPKAFSKFTKLVVALLLPPVIIIGLVIAASQKKFSTANFEFGTLTKITGTYFSKPAPMLKVSSGKDLFGTVSYITVPLVGFGKHGAAGIMEELAKKHSVDLNNKEITLNGTLLYNDGKLLMQVDGNDQPLLHIGQANAEQQNSKDLGMLTLRGEVVDPKCIFGVMKPGYGKVHKDCAIRCIAGGIPPVLKVQNEKGETNFYLIASADGRNINDVVKDFVAEPVAITARAVQQDDWVILYSSKENMQHISKRELAYPALEIASCLTNCKK